jgi:hypothetical protein
MSGRPSAVGSSALVHELLSAARAESVPAASRERVAQKLGVALAFSGVGATVAPAVGDGGRLDGVASSCHLAPRAEVSGRLRLDLGWLGVVSALLVGAPGAAPSRVTMDDVSSIGVASISVASPARPALVQLAAQNSEAVGETTAHLAELSPAPVDMPPEPSAARTMAQPPTRRGVSAGARARRTAAASVASTASPSTLIDEVRQLDRVRSALRRRDGAEALASLEHYERTFAAGELRLEARVLRVTADFAAGHERTARLLARELLVTPGTERYRSELARLLEAHR